MINYDKWKLLNENFMSSQPLGIKKNNGFLAYNKLHEDEEIVFIRIRSREHEIMIAPDKEYTMIVIQDDPSKVVESN